MHLIVHNVFCCVISAQVFIFFLIFSLQASLRKFIDYIQHHQLEKFSKMLDRGLDPNYQDTETGGTSGTDPHASELTISLRYSLSCLFIFLSLRMFTLFLLSLYSSYQFIGHFWICSILPVVHVCSILIYFKPSKVFLYHKNCII